MFSRAQQIEATVASWPDVAVVPHRFGGQEFRVANHEIGHLHGEHHADLPFPRRVARVLIADGRAQPHHWLSETGWVSVPLADDGDVARAVALFRMNYDRIVSAPLGRSGAAPSEELLK